MIGMLVGALLSGLASWLLQHFLIDAPVNLTAVGLAALLGSLTSAVGSTVVEGCFTSLIVILLLFVFFPRLPGLGVSILVQQLIMSGVAGVCVGLIWGGALPREFRD
jgi:hypothetical protein